MLVGVGQLVSLAGSAMSGLGLSVWLWQETGLATALALTLFFSYLPQVLLSPLLGTLIDRWPRKATLALSDAGAALATVATLLLLRAGSLEPWHLYALAAFSGLFGAFQAPAFAAAIPALVSERHFGRANGMLALAHSSANVLAPALAGALLVAVGIAGVLLLDLATFTVALLTLLLVRFPRRMASTPGADTDPAWDSRWQRLTYGFRFIAAKAPLRHLLALYVFVNLVGAVGMVLLAPLVLARTGGDGAALGTVMAALGAGGVVGGLLVSVWGGPRRRILAVLGGLLAVSVLGYGVLAFARGLVGLALGAFSITFFVPFLASAHQAIWQAHVPQAVQGRVFAARQALGKLALPMVMLGAAPLADRLTLAPPLIRVFGLEGAGLALLFLLSGVLGTLVALTGFALPALRQVEERLAAPSA